MARTSSENPVESAEGTPLVDCDVHPRWATEDEIKNHLPPHYQHGDRDLSLYSGWTNTAGSSRADAGDARSDPEKLRAVHFDELGLDYCVLNGDRILHLGVFPDYDYATALARAHNDWLLERWIDFDERFLGSLVVAPQQPEKAAEEIERIGDHPQIVQVLMCSANQHPYGNRFYWPIYEAASAMELPVAIHPGTEGRGIAHPPSAGYPRTYFEWHSAIPTTYQAQLISLVCEGVFVEYPDLNWVCIEGGLAWVPHVMWRLNRNWKSLRSQTPWLDRAPSEYIKQHVRFTTQPFEEAARPEQMVSILEMMDARSTVMFSSDFPHWDSDAPNARGDQFGLPRSLPDGLRDDILYRNAKALYAL